MQAKFALGLSMGLLGLSLLMTSPASATANIPAAAEETLKSAGSAIVCGNIGQLNAALLEASQVTRHKIRVTTLTWSHTLICMGFETVSD